MYAGIHHSTRSPIRGSFFCIPHWDDLKRLPNGLWAGTNRVWLIMTVRIPSYRTVIIVIIVIIVRIFIPVLSIFPVIIPWITMYHNDILIYMI